MWAGIAFKEKLVERWYLWKLDSAEKEEELELAAEELGQMKSKKAIPRLIELFRRGQTLQRSVTFSPDESHIVLRDAVTGKKIVVVVPSHYSFKALVGIGQPAVTALKEFLNDEWLRLAAAMALNEIDPQEYPEGFVVQAALGLDSAGQ